jgi:transcriptional regulator with XRE-family HTH domain
MRKELKMIYQHEVTGRIIRKLRLKKGLSQEVLSGLAGISRSHLAMIEAGTINASVDTLWRIAEALDMKLSELISLVEEDTI